MSNNLIDSQSYGFKEGTPKDAFDALSATVANATGELFYAYTEGAATVEIVPSGGRMFVAGVLTASKTQLQFSVPCKSIDGVSYGGGNITVDTLTANIRHSSGGYIPEGGPYSGGYNFTENYTVTARKGTDHCIEIWVTAQSAFSVNAENNTPIVVQIDALTVTLTHDT